MPFEPYIIGLDSVPGLCSPKKALTLFDETPAPQRTRDETIRATLGAMESPVRPRPTATRANGLRTPARRVPQSSTALNGNGAMSSIRRVSGYSVAGRTSQRGMGSPARRTPGTSLNAIISRSGMRTPTQRTPGAPLAGASRMNGIKTPNFGQTPAVALSPMSEASPILQKTCPPKQTNQPMFPAPVPFSKLQRKLIECERRRSYGSPLRRGWSPGSL
jgi:hypothetical protein